MTSAAPETRRSRRERAPGAPADGASAEGGASTDGDPFAALGVTANALPDSSRAAAEAGRRRPAKPRRRATVTGVLGELLLTAGVVTLLFAGWQMWISPEQRLAESNAEGATLSAQWDADMLQGTGPWATPPPADAPAGEIPVPARPVGTEVFANMLIPRFGADYSVNIAGGTTRPETLDLGRIGLYETSRIPGEIGNFSVAGHRTSLRSTAAFRYIDTLRLNDAIVVETAEGWYTYRFRSLEYVPPSRVEVLADIPQMPGVPANGSYITLTACSPLYMIDERIIAYGVFEGFQPREAGPPASLTEGGA